MISLKHISKQYQPGAKSAVEDLTLEIAPGELVALVGESGSGKTTTLKMINRLIEPTSGEILLDGANASAMDPVELRRGIGYVFQGIGLFPHMTIAENIAVVPGLLNWPESDTQARVDELLNLVSLEPDNYRNRFPAELSGGQRQRVGVARALAARPAVLLMDEPFGALDPITRSDMQGELKKIHQSLEVTIVLVTHDITEALRLADRVGVMESGQLLQCDTPKNMVNHPEHEYVRKLLQTPLSEVSDLQELLEEQ